jgi:hypothetical protein
MGKSDLTGFNPRGGSAEIEESSEELLKLILFSHREKAAKDELPIP